MKLISRYVLRHFLPIFGLALCGFVGLYLIVDFFEKVDNLLEKQVPVLDSCLYFLLKIPSVVNQGIPMAVLLATLISLGLLKRNRELIALEAAGVNAFSYAGPIVVAALCISVLHFGEAETFARTLSQRSEQIWNEQVQHRKSPLTWSHENLWYHGQNTLYQVRLFDPKRKVLEKVSLFYLDPQFRLVQRLDARRFRWDNHHWIAEDGLVLRFNGSEAVQEWFHEKALDLPETPKDFGALKTIPEELGWLDLYHYTKKIRQEGYNSAPYEVELQLRAAFPLTTFILALLGITVALRQGLHGGIAVGIGIALVAAFIYLTVQQVGCAMATTGILPPVVGVWAANIIFAALSAYLWMGHTEAKA